MSLGKGVRHQAEALPNGCTKVQVENDGLAAIPSQASVSHSKWLAFKDDWSILMITNHSTTVPSGTGSRITIRVKVELKLPIPRFLTNRIVAGALEETLNKIDGRLTN